MENGQVAETLCNALSTNTRTISAFLVIITLFMSYVVNRTILLAYVFPSDRVFSLGKTVVNVTILWVAYKCQLICITPLSRRMAKQIWPLLVTSVGRTLIFLATEGPLPLTVTPFCQVYVFVILILEKCVLNITTPFVIQISIVAIIEGALISTVGLPVTWTAYVVVTISSIFVAAYLVYLKIILDFKKFGLWTLLYYDYLFRIVVGLFEIWLTNDLARVAEFNDYKNLYFLLHFHLSCFFEFVQTLSVMLCVQHNSALSTAVLETFVRTVLCNTEILITGEYDINWVYLLGLSVIVFGCLFYYTKFNCKLTNIKAEVVAFNV